MSFLFYIRAFGFGLSVQKRFFIEEKSSFCSSLTGGEIFHLSKMFLRRILACSSGLSGLSVLVLKRRAQRVFICILVVGK